VIGIEARTTNAKESTADGVIPRQWQNFFQQGILAKIPNKIGSNIYALYADYASDRNDEIKKMEEMCKAKEKEVMEIK